MKKIASFIFVIIFFPDSFAWSDIKVQSIPDDGVTNNSSNALVTVDKAGLHYLLADASNNTTADTADIKEKDSSLSINWHKILGWGTLGMAVVTIGSGAFIPEEGHCALAGITTGLAAATCITGYYKYGGLISLSDGDWKINTHAIMGTIATAGFITAVALAGEDGRKIHVAAGAVSGAAFAITLGVLYF
jgi:hypothetical protein